MPITSEQINNWLTIHSETEQLEFKEAKRQFDNVKLFKYCVAIANEGGGHLVLGITDEKPRSVVGTSAFRDTLEMASVIVNELGFRVDIDEIQHPDGRVLVFIIPQRPLGTAYNYRGQYLSL